MRKKSSTIKTPSQPARIWSFGAKFNDKVVAEQAREILYQAHTYRNRLIELERKRRESVSELLRQIDPNLLAMEEGIIALEIGLKLLKEQVDDARIVSRSRAVDPVLADEIRIRRGHRRDLYKQTKIIKTRLYQDPVFKAKQDKIEDDFQAAWKDARAQCGIFWGTYLTIEEARENDRKGAPPRFHPFESEGRIAVQIQGGCDTAALFSGKSAHVQIDPPAAGSGKNPYLNARIRIGSDQKKKPIWLPFVVKIHRSLPTDGRVKWIWLHAIRVATHLKWELQIVTTRDSWDDPGRCLDEEKVVAIDVGWRKLATGIRVASWVDNQGKTGEVNIPQEQVDRMLKVRDIRSIRDKKFNDIKAFCVDELVKHQAPQWMIDRMAFLNKWRSQKRLASIAIFWRDNRFQGDTAFFGVIEAWRKQDKHLYEWERAQARGFLCWRDNFYKNVAAHMSRNYGKAIIEDVDWRIFAKLPDHLSTKEIKEYIRWYNKIAAVSYLNTAIKEKMSKLVRDPPEWTTQACNVCSTIDHFDAEKDLFHTCSKCGTKWDQDNNAAKNLLKWHASGGGGGSIAVAARSP